MDLSLTHTCDISPETEPHRMSGSLQTHTEEPGSSSASTTCMQTKGRAGSVLLHSLEQCCKDLVWV